MQLSHRLEPFAASLQNADAWLADLMEELSIQDPRQTVRVLRATLHTLRDRLAPPQAANLAAQLPLLIQALFYEGFKPESMPERYDLEGFLNQVDRQLQPVDPDPRTAVVAVLGLLQRHVGGGILESIVGGLPADLRTFWHQALS